MVVKKSDFMKSHCRKPVWILAFSWVCGISLGLFLASSMQEEFVSLMCTAAVNRVSIVGLLVMLLLPYVLSVVAFRFSCSVLLFLVVSWKGIYFSFCIYLIMVKFPTTGWLLCRLLLFSEFAILVPTFLFWIRSLKGNKQSLKFENLFYITVVLVVGILDYCIISPFTVNLMSHS